MKILVFSDTHLSRRFDEKKFRHLSRIIRQADQVIINGDLWEGFTTTFDQFLTSRWKELFPLLKQRKTVYIFGNHDKKIFSDGRVSLFSEIQTQRYEFLFGTTTFIFEHGNRYAPLLDEWLGVERAHPIFQYGFSILQYSLVKLFGKRALHVMFGKYNRQIKEKLQDELKFNHIYVCGHTHCAEIDLENRFINSGIIQHGLGQHIWIVDGKMQLAEQWYR